LGPSLAPQAEQTWEVGSNRPVLRNSRPCLRALYSSIAVNADQPASCTDLASRVRASPATHRSSTYTAWLSRMMRVDSIPGATVVPHATNAVGRVGVAVSRSGAELIFDPKTYQLIGEGGVLTKAVPGQGPAGTVVTSTAQLQEKVVDRLPDVPPSLVDKNVVGAIC
jgi:hypothetical protein